MVEFERRGREFVIEMNGLILFWGVLFVKYAYVIVIFLLNQISFSVNTYARSIDVKYYNSNLEAEVGS